MVAEVYDGFLKYVLEGLGEGDATGELADNVDDGEETDVFEPGIETDSAAAIDGVGSESVAYSIQTYRSYLI